MDLAILVNVWHSLFHFVVNTLESKGLASFRDTCTGEDSLHDYMWSVRALKEDSSILGNGLLLLAGCLL